MDKEKIYTNISTIPFSRPLNISYLSGFVATSSKYKFRLTQHMVALINSSDSSSLRKQFLPDARELEFKENEFYDVAEENAYSPVYGVVHRYPDKALLLLTLNCPTYCRFCYRKEKLNDKLQKKILQKGELDAAFDYIAQENISEVIFSGGDPFFCANEVISDVIDRLNRLPSIKIVRFHTRYFTFQPKRIDIELIELLKKKKTTFLVLHVNQPEEITKEFIDAVNLCVNNGIPLFSQTALLKDVNDSPNILRELFSRLIEHRVKPYYLFHTDPARGLSHFRVKLSDGIAIYNSLYDRISGLAMPIYLFNIPGGYGHSIIDLGNVKKLGGDEYELTAWNGTKVHYKDI